MVLKYKSSNIILIYKNGWQEIRGKSHLLSNKRKKLDYIKNDHNQILYIRTVVDYQDMSLYQPFHKKKLSEHLNKQDNQSLYKNDYLLQNKDNVSIKISK